MEKTVKHFCTTAKRIQKDVVKFASGAAKTLRLGVFVIGGIGAQILREKTPNISIRYTGTWKNSLQLGVGIGTMIGGAGAILLGGGGSIASGGAAAGAGVPVIDAGVVAVGIGAGVTAGALRDMFDVRIQKSESSKGDGAGESGNSSNELKDVYNSIKNSPDYPKDFEAVKNGTTKNTIKNKELLDELREIEPGKRTKVYKDGYDSSGNKISIHYFQSQSGKVFNVKVKPGWSN